MPFGPQPLGFVYFAAAKFAGYTAYSHWAIAPRVKRSRSPERPVPSSWKAGAVRTGIGVTVGAVVGISFWKIPYFATHDFISSMLFYCLLIPVRIGEWWLLLRWIYWPTGLSRAQIAWLIFFGILVSFALDLAGVLSAIIIPGGAWVC